MGLKMWIKVPPKKKKNDVGKGNVNPGIIGETVCSMRVVVMCLVWVR